jgi:uncharacterized membrane protein
MADVSELRERKTPPAIDPMEWILSVLLRGGVVASMATVLVGVALMFVHHPPYLTSADDLARLTAPGAAFPHTLRDVASGIAAGRGQAVVALGLMLLIATPILRVAVSIVAFALQRDRLYTALTAAVLLILLVSLLLGKTE